MPRALLLVLLAACSGPPEPAAPSADAGVDACELDGGACSGEARARCRIDRLLDAAQVCEKDAECKTFRFPSNCLDFGRCPTTALTWANEARASIEITDELNAFCNATLCRLSSRPCTETRTPKSLCVSGRCTLVYPVVDAGVRDGGP